jgi:hypothetical protein
MNPLTPEAAMELLAQVTAETATGAKATSKGKKAAPVPPPVVPKASAARRRRADAVTDDEEDDDDDDDDNNDEESSSRKRKTRCDWNKHLEVGPLLAILKEYVCGGVCF